MNWFILKGILFSTLLLLAAAWDIKQREIPNLIPVLIFFRGFILVNPLNSSLGLVITGLPYYLAAVLSLNREGFLIGGGDIKLISACGFVLGIWGGIFQSIVSLTLTLIIGTGICVSRQTRKLDKVTLLLAPFFCVGEISSFCAYVTTGKLKRQEDL